MMALWLTMFCSPIECSNAPVTGSTSLFRRLYLIVGSVGFVNSVGRKSGSVEVMSLSVLDSCSR